MPIEPFTKRPFPVAAAGVVIAVTVNLLFSFVFPLTLGFPLFMDCIMTVAITLFAGLVPGLATGLAYNAVWSLVIAHDPRQALFGLCSMACALTVFVSLKHRKERWLLVDLLLLSLWVCLISSALGGIISTFAFQGIDHFPSDYIMAGMLMQDLPLVGAAILARIPLNFIDKIVAVFLGYGVFLLAGNLRAFRDVRTR
jgi:energy-coupling factor transport system substrate-specific component